MFRCTFAEFLEKECLTDFNTAFVPRQHFKAVAEQLPNNAFTILNASRQSGKTSLITRYGHYYALANPNANVLIITQRYPNNDHYCSLITKHYRFSQYSEITDSSLDLVTFYNGSNIHIRSAWHTTYEKMNDKPWDLILHDEAAKTTPSYQFLSQFLIDSVDRGTKVVMASTPGPAEGLFYNFWMSQDRRITKIEWPWHVDPQQDFEWENKLRSYLGSRFDQEFGCKFSK